MPPSPGKRSTRAIGRSPQLSTTLPPVCPLRLHRLHDLPCHGSGFRASSSHNLASGFGSLLLPMPRLVEMGQMACTACLHLRKLGGGGGGISQGPSSLSASTRGTVLWAGGAPKSGRQLRPRERLVPRAVIAAMLSPVKRARAP